MISNAILQAFAAQLSWVVLENETGEWYCRLKHAERTISGQISRTAVSSLNSFAPSAQFDFHVRPDTVSFKEKKPNLVVASCSAQNNECDDENYGFGLVMNIPTIMYVPPLMGLFILIWCKWSWSSRATIAVDWEVETYCFCYRVSSTMLWHTKHEI